MRWGLFGSMRWRLCCAMRWGLCGAIRRGYIATDMITYRAKIAAKHFNFPLFLFNLSTLHNGHEYRYLDYFYLLKISEEHLANCNGRPFPAVGFLVSKEKKKKIIGDNNSLLSARKVPANKIILIQYLVYNHITHSAVINKPTNTEFC
jgi:hypothetical protein